MKTPVKSPQKPNRAPKPDSVLLTIPEVAAELRLHAITCYKLAGKGKIPTIHIGKAVRVRRSDLLSFVSAQTVAME